MTSTEISTQIAKASGAISASPFMSAIQVGLEWAQEASSRLSDTPEVQQFLAEAARRREQAQIEEARRLEEATLALDRARRSRLRRVFLTWGHHLQAEGAPQEVFIPAPAARQAERSGSVWPSSEPGLAGYLQDAHLHPAIARPKAGGARGWFADWRDLALAALHEGLSAGDVASIALATPRPKEALTRAPVPGAARPAPDRLRERFTAVAHPNAPGGVRLDPSHVTGGEPAATTA